MSDLPALVLVPGLSCDAALWNAQVAGLADVARMTVADTLSDDSIPAMATRLLDTAPERFAIAGLSMGGYVAMEVIRRAPERVTGLALLDTNARADTPDQARLRHFAIRTAQDRGLEAVIRGSLAQIVHPDADPHVAEAVVAMALRVGLPVFENQQTAIMTRTDPLPGLAAVRVPALVVVGEQDLLTPPHYAEEMAAAIPGAVLRVIPECSHMATMERPDAVNAALRVWLALPG